MKQFPRQLERDEGFAGSRRQSQQDALLVRRDGLQHIIDRTILIVARTPQPALVLERHGSETLSPCFDSLSSRRIGR